MHYTIRVIHYIWCVLGLSVITYAAHLKNTNFLYSIQKIEHYEINTLKI